ncbi:MAG: molecular chaperone HtpG, partial [Oscillospiraceae bacterium]|nr:molecular chaperone HtpG [Oscillospiraceae bacterium]
EYVENMPESQKAIYYATADSVKHAMSLPQCEEVRSRGYELIYLTSALDEMVVETLRDQDGKTFCNVVTDDLGFETEEEKKAAEERNTESKEFLDFVKETLKDDVAKVRLSGKLASQPCALTTDGGITLEMEKYFSRGPSEEMRSIKATRVLELNPENKAVKALRSAYESGEKEKAADLAKILSTLAKMMAGVDVEDPAEFTKQVSELF